MRTEVFDDLVNFLVEKLPPQESISFCPTPEAQKWFNELSATLKTDVASAEERAVMELNIELEHMMQLAKARRAVNKPHLPLFPDDYSSRSSYHHDYSSHARYIPKLSRRKTGQIRCEYCLIHADDAYYTLHRDCIIAEKHGGSASDDNLALSCAECNWRKGTQIAALTPSRREIALFNPRLQRWGAHFRVEGGTIEPLTRIGEVTAHLLDFNDETRVEIRRTLAQLKLYPRL